MEAQSLTSLDKKVIQRFLDGVVLSTQLISEHFSLHGHLITTHIDLNDINTSTYLAQYVKQPNKLPTIRVFHGNRLTNIFTTEIENAEFYNTATTENTKLYCPIACQDCEMSYRCAVMDDSTRIEQAKPSLLSSESEAIFF